MSNEISIGEADLVIAKLYSEAVPVIAYYAREGVKVMRHGIVTGISPEVGLTISDAESVLLYDYLAVSLGSPTGTGCTFWYGDKRGLSEETVEKLGDTVLLIICPDGGQLKLYFSL